MTDLIVRKYARAGRITLNRPAALNALTYDMCIEIERSLDRWASDPDVHLVIFDSVGERAFCAGGDIAQLYETGRAGNFAFGRKFWADEYRLNAKIYSYPKPLLSFLQGFTMGGGVGVGCHGTHRIVGTTSRIAMPECGIGLIPDVGGSLLLALAPGRLGEYLGTTAHRMSAADAIYAGFADLYIAEEHWPDLITTLCDLGETTVLAPAATDPGKSELRAAQGAIDALFAGENLSDIRNALKHAKTAFSEKALEAMSRNAPLSMAATIEVIRRLRGPSASMSKALDLEYRFTSRAMEHGDFLEGIRAAIIDKDRNPKWQYADGKVPVAAVSRMLMPLGEKALKLEE